MHATLSTKHHPCLPACSNIIQLDIKELLAVAGEISDLRGRAALQLVICSGQLSELSAALGADNHSGLACKLAGAAPVAHRAPQSMVLVSSQHLYRLWFEDVQRSNRFRGLSKLNNKYVHGSLR